MVNVGILGAGFMGSTHARAFARLPDVTIAAIYAPTDHRARPLAEELGTRWTDNFANVLDDPAIDAIDICLPSTEHRHPTEVAIGAGKHVLLEKPIALTMDDADALVRLAGATDLVFMVAHVLRFWPEYVELQRRVASGEYGRPVSALAYRRQPFPAWSELFSKPELTGGAVIDMMIHDYDVLNWMLGVPSTVDARGIMNPRTGGWDQVQTLIDYGDRSAMVDGGMLMPESYPFSSSVQVLCERGALEYYFRAGGRSVEMGAGVNELICYPNDGPPFPVTVEQQDPYQDEIEYFVKCIESGVAATRATPVDARLALSVALAARTSIEQGGPVAVGNG